MGQPSRSELQAYEVVWRVRGVDVEHYDTGGRQAAVDAIIRYRDGREAALEVTTLTDPAGREVESLLARGGFAWHVAGLAWGWTARVTPTANLREVKRRLPDILGWCERHDVTDPHVNAWVHDKPGARQVIEWLDRCGVRVWGYPDSNRPGMVMPVPEAKGGATGDMTAITTWLSGELRSERVASKVRKLQTSGFEETHLFLIVDDSGAPFAGFYARAFGHGLPTGKPLDPPVSAVWLAPRWSPTVLL